MLSHSRIVQLRDELLPSQGEAFDCVAFATAVQLELLATMARGPNAIKLDGDPCSVADGVAAQVLRPVTFRIVETASPIEGRAFLFRLLGHLVGYASILCSDTAAVRAALDEALTLIDVTGVAKPQPLGGH